MPGLSVSPQGGFLMVEFDGIPILNALVAERTGHELRELVEQGKGEAIVLDFSRVQLMTSGMIGEFMKLQRRCEEKGVKLLFFNLSKELLDVFKVCRLDKVLKIVTSHEAIAKELVRRK
jgi:anti-anti-sigma factor